MMLKNSQLVVAGFLIFVGGCFFGREVFVKRSPQIVPTTRSGGLSQYLEVGYQYLYGQIQEEMKAEGIDSATIGRAEESIVPCVQVRIEELFRVTLADDHRFDASWQKSVIDKTKVECRREFDAKEAAQIKKLIEMSQSR